MCGRAEAAWAHIRWGVQINLARLLHRCSFLRGPKVYVGMGSKATFMVLAFQGFPSGRQHQVSLFGGYAPFLGFPFDVHPKRHHPHRVPSVELACGCLQVEVRWLVPELVQALIHAALHADQAGIELTSRPVQRHMFFCFSKTT